MIITSECDQLFSTWQKYYIKLRLRTLLLSPQQTVQ